MVRNALLRERAERQAEEVVVAFLLLWDVEALEFRLALCLRCILQSFELAIKLEPDELADALVLGELIAEFLELCLATLLLHLQTNLRILLQNVLKAILFGDDALRVEGVHVRNLDLIGQCLGENLFGHALHANVDVLIRGEIREVLGRSIGHPLLQRLTEVRSPETHGKLRNHILVLLLAEHSTHAAILCKQALEPTEPRLKRRLLKSGGVTLEPLAERILQHVGVARRHERRVARTNPARTIHEKHREHGSLELGLHRCAVIIAILKDAEVICRNQFLDLGLQMSVDVSGARRVLAPLQTCTELSLRNEPRKIVGAHEVLRHADDRVVE